MTSFAELRQDFAYGVRMLAKSPGYSAVAVLSLALGIGANTAIFSLIDSVILKMLPVRNPQELVALTDPTDSGVWIGTSDGERGILSTREFEGLRDRTQTFSGVLAAESQMSSQNASVNGEPPEEIHTRLVSGNYFTVLGANALVGRAFWAADERGPGIGAICRPQLQLLATPLRRRVLRHWSAPARGQGRPHRNRRGAAEFSRRADRRCARRLGSAGHAAATDAGPHVAGGRPRTHCRKGDVAASHRPPQTGRHPPAGAGQRRRGFQTTGGRGIFRAQPQPAQYSETESETA